MSELDTYPHEFVGGPADPPVQPSEAEIAEGRRIAAALVEAAGPVEAVRFGAAPWRVAASLTVLRGEANAANPRRDRASDGTIGDAAHASRASDHNPWVIVDGWGVVRALDLDVNGLDLPTAFERIRRGAASGGLVQVRRGGYLILNRRITRPDWSGWNVYEGPNPHTGHGHVSASRVVAGFDSRAAWRVFGATPATPGGFTGPDLTGTGTSLRGDEGDNGRRVLKLQTELRRLFPLYARGLTADGWWGAQTRAVLDEFARRSGVPEADGRNIGPRLAAALYRAGVRA